MKLRFKPVVAGAAALALAGTGMVALAGSASAYTGTPPWAAGDTFSKGTLTFYDASGNILTGGTNVNNLGAYIATTTAQRTGATKANVTLAFPDHGNSIPATWYNQTLQGSTTFSPAPAGTPANIGNAFVKLNLGATDVTDGLSGGTLDSSSAAYQNVFEIRLQDSGATVVPDGAKYWAGDIEYNPPTATAAYDGLAPGAWRVVNGNIAPVSTTTTVTAAPASGADTSTSVVFTAAVSANGGGTVTFKDGATQIGAVKTLAGASVASDPISLTAGSHTITATFTPSAAPANQAGYAASTGTLTPYNVTAAAAVATTTTLGAFTGVDGTSSVAQPGVVGGSAVVTKTAGGTAVTAGSVSFFTGSTLISTDSNGADGFSFSVNSSTLPLGANSITAVYNGTAAFLTSTSAAGNITVTAPQYAADTQYISTSIAPGTLVINTPYTQASPLVLAAMSLNTSATLYSTSATFGAITVTDTRPGNLPYTLSALASNLTTGTGATANQQISGENVGLTTLTKLPATNVTPNTFGAGQNLVPSDNAAAAGVQSTDGGTAGLGGATPHTILHAGSGLGTTAVQGTLTINAPTNTLPGTYNGTVTFTIIGS